jgi:hypothetical protein
MAQLLHFTDSVSGMSVAINPSKVVCVFTNKDPDSGLETTVINLVNGNVGVTEDYLETVGRLQGSLSN